MLSLSLYAMLTLSTHSFADGYIPGQWIDLMDEERGRPVPLKHAKTSDNFNEPPAPR